MYALREYRLCQGLAGSLAGWHAMASTVVAIGAALGSGMVEGCSAQGIENELARPVPFDSEGPY